MLKLIVGLGNFKSRYFKTRHNAGAWYIEELVKYYCLPRLQNEMKFNAYIGKVSFNNTIVRLLIPTTYINMSGISVFSIVQFYHLSIEEILVVHDELDLPPGVVKLKFSGGHNGHNGVRNIIETFGNNNFYRLRIGIGRPINKNFITDFVLSEPPLKEKEEIYKIILKSVHYTDMVIAMNFSKFMQYLNK